MCSFGVPPRRKRGVGELQGTGYRPPVLIGPLRAFRMPHAFGNNAATAANAAPMSFFFCHLYCSVCLFFLYHAKPWPHSVGTNQILYSSVAMPT